MSLEYIFSKNYLFDPNPTSESRLYLYLLIFFSLLIILGVVAIFFKGMDEKIRKKEAYCFFISGSLGLIYLFARYEELIWLGSRLFFVLTILTFTIWIMYIIFFSFTYLPKKIQKEEANKRFEKYLPRNKN